MLPTSDTSDRPLATHLLVHCLRNKLVAKDIVVLKPHCEHWPGSKAVQEEEPDHLVDLFQIKGLVVSVDGPAESGALGRCSCIRGVDDAPQHKLLRDLCVEEVFRTAVTDFIRQEFPSGIRYVSFFRWRTVGVLLRRRKLGPTHLLLFTATVLMLGGPCYTLDIRGTIESHLSASKHVDTGDIRSWFRIENHPPREG